MLLGVNDCPLTYPSEFAIDTLRELLIEEGIMYRLSHQFACRRASARPYQLARRSLTTKSPFLRISEEVRDAVHTGKPVVALETTIYTHGKVYFTSAALTNMICADCHQGFPYPENVALSSRLESLVRDGGGVPATIGLLRGTAMVGMGPEELIELLESAGNHDTIKLSRKDLGYACGLVCSPISSAPATRPQSLD